MGCGKNKYEVPVTKMIKGNFLAVLAVAILAVEVVNAQTNPAKIKHKEQELSERTRN